MNEGFLIAVVKQQTANPANSAASSTERVPVEVSGQHSGCCITATCSLLATLSVNLSTA